MSAGLPGDRAAGAALADLLEVMRRLRDPAAGCPWDIAQDFASIVPHTLEEAHEVADAIARRDWPQVCDELGDLLFQVVFYARLGEEQGLFDFAAVAAGIRDKLTRRHPHVFAPQDSQASDAESLHKAWERGKADERTAQGATGALDGVALALPALTRAAKLGKRAARVGFDWQDTRAVTRKVQEELAELTAEIAAGEHQAAREELGDLLFALAQYSRHLGLDPEDALRHANRKFALRFAAMERILAARNARPEDQTADDWDALWVEVKKAEKAGK